MLARTLACREELIATTIHYTIERAMFDQITASLRNLFIAYAVLTSSVLIAEDKPDVTPGPPPHPEIQREFRAAWIATVANIDWPSQPGLSEEIQKQELAVMLELAAELKMNAIVFQVRPACDALYASKLEPWSEYLSGTQGVGPKTYDPLEFACEEGKRLGLEIHAWFNPYRSAHPSSKSKLAKDHVTNTIPGSVKQYGKYGWLDPGDKAAAQHSLDVVIDVVRRYDIDGVHFDDYFYPYPISEKDSSGKSVEVPFPDDASWNIYCDKTPESDRLSRGDWRRDNVNRFIKKIGEEVHATKPHVRFGVSPFGIWRPGHPESIKGFDQYDKLYADAKLWLEEGWVDYFTPQLYWPIDQKAQSFPILLNWWSEHNPHQRHLWPGMYTSKVGIGEPPWKPREIVNQIITAREQRGSSGHVHFSMKAIAQNYNGLQEALREYNYNQPALIPATDWLADGEAAPSQPKLDQIDKQKISLQCEDGKQPSRWVVHTLHHETWSSEILPGVRSDYNLKTNAEGVHPSRVVAIAVDRLGRESTPTTMDLDQ